MEKASSAIRQQGFDLVTGRWVTAKPSLYEVEPTSPFFLSLRGLCLGKKRADASICDDSNPINGLLGELEKSALFGLGDEIVFVRQLEELLSQVNCLVKRLAKQHATRFDLPGRRPVESLDLPKI